MEYQRHIFTVLRNTDVGKACLAEKMATLSHDEKFVFGSQIRV